MNGYRIPTYRVRLVRERAVTGPRMCTAVDVAGLVRALWRRADMAREYMWAIHLDGNLRTLGAEQVAAGGAAGCTVTVSDILRGAILAGARSVVLAHVHPSGSAEPSADDLAMTRAVRDGCAAIGVPLVDHVIVAAGEHTSMCDRGIL